MAVIEPKETELVVEREKIALQELAGIINLNAQQMAEMPVLTLWSPTVLTALMNNHQYKKVNHIGGEEFKFHSAYVGKRGTLIFQLAPVAAADYRYVEFTDADAVKQLSAWRSMTNQLAGGDFATALADVTRARKEHAAATKQAEHVEKYEEIGGGTW